jgi:hypothetical protein
VRLASFSFFLTLTDPVFLKQSLLAPTRKRSSSYSCTFNVCYFSSLSPSTAGKLTKFPCDSIYTESPPDTNDTQLGHYLIATWAKVCQEMGPAFKR